jgi:glycosyltransferase involved in cell wall biosynthesis
MKVIHLNHTSLSGGAARAAHRIHRALLQAGEASSMAVLRSDSDDPSVQECRRPWNGWGGRYRTKVEQLVTRRLRTANPILHSPALLPSGWPRLLAGARPDLVNLHWINGEMMSIEDIARIRAPLVWTLHDMWAFCGAEHYAGDERWLHGYPRGQRPDHERGPDLCGWVWRRKRRAWRRPFQLVAPSRWMADCVARSALMRGWPVRVIANPIDTAAWAPVDRPAVRALLGLPLEARLVLFVASGGAAQRIKGFDLLRTTVGHLADSPEPYHLVVVGQSAPREAETWPFPVHYLGHLHDDLSLRCAYGAADAVVVPSRQDNLPNVGVEALACGTPVVAFDTCGLPDLVTHQSNGWLAPPFDTEALARGIAWCTTPGPRLESLRAAARASAVARFSPAVVAAQYVALYREVLDGPGARLDRRPVGPPPVVGAPSA